MTNHVTGGGILSEYLGRLASDLVVTSRENGYVVMTPFKRPDGKVIGLDVASLPDGRVRVSDRGGSFGYLYINGLSFSRPALESVERIAESYGVTPHNEVLVAVSDAASVGDALHRVAQAAVSVTALVAALETGWLGRDDNPNPIPATTENHEADQRPRDPFADGALAALQRAAKKARRRAVALDGYVATFTKDGKIVYDTEP